MRSEFAFVCQGSIHRLCKYQGAKYIHSVFRFTYHFPMLGWVGLALAARMWDYVKMGNNALRDTLFSPQLNYGL